MKNKKLLAMSTSLVIAVGFTGLMMANSESSSDKQLSGNVNSPVAGVVASLQSGSLKTEDDLTYFSSVKDLVLKNLPETKILDISKATEQSSFYSIYTDKGIYYASLDEALIFNGEVINANDGVNISYVHNKYLDFVKTLNSQDVKNFTSSDKTRRDIGKERKPAEMFERLGKFGEMMASSRSASHSDSNSIAKRPSSEKKIKQGSISKFGLDKNGTPLSETEKSAQIAKFAALVPNHRTINYWAENEVEQLFVFSDYTCGVCRKLHKEVPKLNEAGISVRYLFYPRVLSRGMGPKTEQVITNMSSAWCSEDQNKALDRLYSKLRIETKSCADLSDDLQKQRGKSPVVQHYSIGKKFGIDGTPLSFTRSGKTIEGYDNARKMIPRILN